MVALPSHCFAGQRKTNKNRNTSRSSERAKVKPHTHYVQQNQNLSRQKKLSHGGRGDPRRAAWVYDPIGAFDALHNKLSKAVIDVLHDSLVEDIKKIALPRCTGSLRRYATCLIRPANLAVDPNANFNPPNTGGFYICDERGRLVQQLSDSRWPLVIPSASPTVTTFPVGSSHAGDRS